MAWLVAPYEPVTRPGGDRGPRPGRSLGHLPAQTPGEPEPWVEWETLHPWRCLIWAPGVKARAAIGRMRDVERLPDLPLDQALGELTAGERSSLIQIMEFLGYAKPLDGLRAHAGRADLKIGDVRLATVLQLLASWRRKGRRDEHGEFQGDGELRGSAKPLPGVLAGGAIVDTSLDTFDGTGALDTDIWGGKAYAVDELADRLSGVARNPGPGTYGGAHYTGATSSADSSSWAEHGTVEYNCVGVRGADAGTSLDGYEHCAGPTYSQVARADNDGWTQLGSNITQTWSSGDKVGCEVTGTTIDAQRNTGSGWSSLGTRTDSTYSAAGVLYFYLDAPGTITEFGGGPGLGSTTQTLTLNHIDSSATIHNPTVAAATPQTITLPLLDASAAIHAPTVEGVAQTITLPLIDSSVALHAPTVAAAAPQGITVPLLVSTATLHQPTVESVAQTIELGLLDSSATIHEPTLANTAQEVSLPLLDSSAALHALTVAPAAAQAITLPLLDSSAVVHEPTLANTAQEITLALLDSSATLHQPAVATAAPQAITLPLLDSSATVHAPTVENAAAGAQTLTLPLLDASATVHAPTVAAATAQTITLPLLDASATVHQPTVQNTAQTIELPLLDASADLHHPTIENTAQEIVLPLLDASATVHGPTVSAATPQEILADYIASSTVVYDLEIAAAAAQEIVLPLLDASATVFAPVVYVGETPSASFDPPGPTLAVTSSPSIAGIDSADGAASVSSSPSLDNLDPPEPVLS